MKFCTKCGHQIHDEAIVCVYCGCPVAIVTAQQKDDKKLLRVFAQKVDTYGTIAIAVGIIQILTLFGFFMGILNIYLGVVNKKNAKQLVQSPHDIVKTYSPAGTAIFILVFNLFFGAVIGIIGSIYWLVAVRGYVLNNIDEFEQMEHE